MELTHFSPKIEDLQIRAYKRQSFTVYKLLSSIWQDIIFLFQIERPSFLLILMSEALTRSSCHFYCDQPGYLPFMYKLLFKYTVTLTTFCTHSLAHAHTLGDNALQWGLRWPKAAKHLQNFLSTIRKKKRKKFQKQCT